LKIFKKKLFVSDIVVGARNVFCQERGLA
jgi:hypothetical protein